MTYYLVLLVVTVCYLALALAVWQRTREIAFAIGLGFLYYWTLWGAWFIVYDLRGGDSGMQYQYFFYKMFPLHLDTDYFWTLILYSLFLLTIQVVLLCMLRSTRKEPPLKPIVIFHGKMLLLAGVAGVVSYLIVRNSFSAAASLGVSGYQYVRNDASISRWFTLHQLLNRTSLFTCMVGLSVYFAGRNAVYIAGAGRRWHLFTYLGLLAGLFAMNLFLGDRHELVSSFLAGGLFYLANDRRPKKLLIFSALALVAVAVGIVGMTRGQAVAQAVSDLGVFQTVVTSLFTSLTSNEPFAAHMSMYGVLHKHVPITYGLSIVSFLLSLVPRAIWENRPGDIYVYYATSIGTIEGQGYTIHHATGWYLNFGVLGVVAGAIVVAWSWAKLWDVFRRSIDAQSHVSRVFRALGFWTFTASISGLIRSGPEGYKTVLLDISLPALIVVLAGVRLVMRYNRPYFLLQRPTAAASWTAGHFGLGGVNGASLKTYEGWN